MPALLENRVALVTAGTSGIGAAISRAFVRNGAAVIVHYRSQQTAADEIVAEAVASGGRAVAAGCDLREAGATRDAINAAADAVGPVDILVNNASIFLPATPVEAVRWEDLQAEFEGSLMTAFNATQTVLPGMLERRWGRVLFLIGTMLQRPVPGYAAHASGKGALQAFGRTLAREVAPRGVAVHFLSPGMALTPNVLATEPEAEREALRARTPNRHLPTPEELARIAVFLASDMAMSATALHLNADGGLADLGGA